MINKLLIVGLVSILTAANPDWNNRKEKVVVHTWEDFSSPRTFLLQDSHEINSSLERIPDMMSIVCPGLYDGDETAIYPRMKKLPDGKWLLLYQGGRLGPRIYATQSEDFKTWSPPCLLFAPYPIDEGKDRICFATADAAVLPDSSILVVASFRAEKGYKNSYGCGLVTRRSTDGGKTWSVPEVILDGPNWEPYLLVLPDGRVQCYFTDCLPSERDSGTSILESYDYGGSWTGYRKICRQYKYSNDNGYKVYTDQMPSFRVLSDGKTIFGFLEARLEPDGQHGKSIYKMSLVWNHGLDWEGLDHSNGTGPLDRKTNVIDGCAGYVSVFPSGEVLISCNINGIFSMKIGDSTAERFRGREWNKDWFQPFSGKGYWGASEIASNRVVAGSMHCKDGLQMGMFFLNRPMKAIKKEILIDGDNIEWNSDEAFWLSDERKGGTTIRFANDGENLYVLCETSSVEKFEGIELIFSKEGADSPQSIIINREHDDKVKSASVVGFTKEGERGVVTEVSIPLSSLSLGGGDSLMFNASHINDRPRKWFDGTLKDEPDTWMKVVIE